MCKLLLFLPMHWLSLACDRLTSAAATVANAAAGCNVLRQVTSSPSLPVLLDGRPDAAEPVAHVPVGGVQVRSRSSSMERQQHHQGDIGVKLPDPAQDVMVHQAPSSKLNTDAGAAEIAGLLAAFNEEAAASSRQATHQAVQQLCLLHPTEAVCAIALTLDKLAHQSESSCRSAVAQLLHDLAAYINTGSMVLQNNL